MDEQQPYEPLTAREREILNLLVQRLSDREIGEQLYIAPTTVKWFNRQIFTKLGVENRKQAVEQAAALGLVDPGEEPPPAPQHNLPAALTPFIGRSTELDEVQRLLAYPHTRLVTILAPGGMGKTRLALEVAGALLDQYADGVYFAALARVSAPDSVVPAIAEALGAHFMPDNRTPQQQLTDFLRRKHLLLILDNFEQLVDGAPLVADLLAAAPQVRILATSRESLNVTGEVVYPLAGIQYPGADVDDPLRYGAVQLFIQCALRANPHFNASDTASIAHICRFAQGMPLAIELAAAWARTLSAADIAAEIARSADFLKTSMRDVPERQRSVRAVFEASWARLDEDERRAFRWMSVFCGGCTREAAHAVTGASLPTLAALVDKAMIWRDSQADRYEVHELLRQYAESELEKAGETEAARHGHQTYYAALTAKWGAAMLLDKVEEGLAIFDADIENVHSAFARASERAVPAEVEPFADLWMYYRIRSNWREALAVFGDAIRQLEPHDSLALAKLLIAHSIFAFESTDLAAYHDAQRSVELLRRLNEPKHLPSGLISVADYLRSQGRLPEAKALYLEAMGTLEANDHPLVIASVTRKLGLLARAECRYEEASELLTDAYRQAQALNNVWELCYAADSLAGHSYYLGDLETAQRLYETELANARKIGARSSIDMALDGLANITRDQRDWEASRWYALEILQIRLDIGQSDESVFEIAIYIADMSLRLGEIEEARRSLRQAEAYRPGVTHPLLFKVWLQVAALYFVHIGEHERAAAFVSYFELVTIPTRPYLFPITYESVAECLEHCRATLTPEEFAAAVERGKTLTPEAAIAELMPYLQ